MHIKKNKQIIMMVIKSIKKNTNLQPGEDKALLRALGYQLRNLRNWGIFFYLAKGGSVKWLVQPQRNTQVCK